MPVQVPNRGDRLRAEWGASVARAVNGIGVCAPSGMLVRDGAGGQGFQPLPENRRTRAPKIDVMQIPFRLRYGTEKNPEQSATPSFRAFVDMYCTSSVAVTYDGVSVTASGIEDPNLSPGETCDLGSNGWQRIHQTDYSSPAPAIENLDLWIELSKDDGVMTWTVVTAPSNSSEVLACSKIGHVNVGISRQEFVGTQRFSSEATISSGNPAPFDIVSSTSPGGETIKSVTNCTFYFDGVEKTLSDYDVTSLMQSSGTLYLVCTKSESDDTWSFSLSPATGSGDSLSFKIYTFSYGNVLLDYRTTFLSISSGHGSSDPVECDELSTTLSETSELTGKVAVKGHVDATENQVFAKGPNNPVWQLPITADGTNSSPNPQRCYGLKVAHDANTNLTCSVSVANDVATLTFMIRYV